MHLALLYEQGADTGIISEKGSWVVQDKSNQ